MKSRERFLLACQHKEADRIPISLGGTAGKVYESTMRQMMDFYGIPQDKIEFYPAGFKYVPFCEELYRCLGVDNRTIYPMSSSKEMLEAQKNQGSFTSRWGCRFEYHDQNAEWAHLGLDLPLASEDLTVEDVKNYNWPRPDKTLTAGLREKALKYYNEGEYAIGVYRVLEAGIFGSIHNFLRGMQQFFIDLVSDEDLANALLDGMLETQEAYYGAVLDEIGDLVDYVETEDDMGMTHGPLVSPEIYKSMIKPRHAALYAFIRSKCRPGTKIFMHSDGSVRLLIPDYIDAGVDILNPIQVNCVGMQLEGIKKDFGKDLVFNGCLDVLQPFEGTMQDAKDAVKRTIDVMGPGGGFIFGPTHNYSPHIALEKILMVFEYAKEYGKY
jgi:uroporphyrinogen decarboxylase